MEDSIKLKRLNKLRHGLLEIENKLPSLSKIFDWDYNKLLLPGYFSSLDCSLIRQHREHQILEKKLKPLKRNNHFWSEGYDSLNKEFSEYSGVGSCISLSSQLMNSVADNIASGVGNKTVRSVPKSSAEFDQNFNREEKLAIYDYVIANTKKQANFSDLWSQSPEKKQHEKEMTALELAAADRDAKRRRASYRNKVHINSKTHTEILREVIREQMDMLKENTISEKWSEERKRGEKSNVDSIYRGNKRKCENSPEWRNGEDYLNRKHENVGHLTKNHCKKNWEENSKWKSKCRDKYKNWKTSEGRPRFQKSSR